DSWFCYTEASVKLLNFKNDAMSWSNKFTQRCSNTDRGLFEHIISNKELREKGLIHNGIIVFEVKIELPRSWTSERPLESFNFSQP
ncbi:hypothetical protein PFISCL1PPCAC_21130, partial [Pristionchus fissidentatus]